MDPVISINTLAYEGYDLTTALQEIARIGAGHVEMGFTRGFTEGTDQILTSGKTGAELVKGIGSDFIKLNYNRKSQ